MNKKLEILYPRFEAKFYRSNDTDEKSIMRQISALEKGKTIKRYKKLLELLNSEREKIPRFICGNCSNEQKLKELKLFRFISCSNTMDNDRYKDDNIICPKCGYFNYVKDADGKFSLKQIEEVQQ